MTDTFTATPGIRKKRGDNEHKLQVMVVDYLAAAARSDCYWYAIPNAGHRSLRMGARMKREGLRAGLADLEIMLPGRPNAYLEMKTSTGRQSVEQKNFQAICLKLGHPYAVARTFDEATKILRLWGALK